MTPTLCSSCHQEVTSPDELDLWKYTHRCKKCTLSANGVDVSDDVADTIDPEEAGY
jgi:peptide subunit release factor 1 (eRF1)